MATGNHESRSSFRRPLLALVGAGLLLTAAGLLLPHPGAGAPRPAGGAIAPSPAPRPDPPVAAAPAVPTPPPAPVVAANAGATARPPAAPDAAGAQLALPRPIRYAAIGASDTVGVGTADPARENWTAQLAAQLPPDTVYRTFARGGITLSEALTYEVPRAIAFQPTLVTVWLVVNDALRGVPLPLYQRELRALLDQLTTRTDATVVLLNVPDLAAVLHGQMSAQTQAEMRAIAGSWNATIAAAAAPYGARVRIADLYGPSAGTPVPRSWISADGFHPNVIGYSQIANLVAGDLRQGGLVP